MFTSHLGFSSPVVRFRNFRAISLKLLAGIFAASALLVPRAAYANTYRVTDTSDNAADTGSLRHAVNTAVDGDTIQFSAGAIGTVTLTNGTLLISHSVTITGPGANVLTISGNNAVPVFTMYSSSSVSMSGLTIANGNSATNGGGIYNNSGTWTVNNCAFYANTTAAGGGAIASGGTLAVSNSTFSGNTAMAGAAVFNNGGTSSVENSTFSGNNAAGGPGGAIFNNGTMAVSNSTISGNTGGGGIFNNPGHTLTLASSIVTGNTPSGNDCGQCGTQSMPNLIGGAADLGPLQYNGGSTLTMMPLSGSPAIGAGSGSKLTPDQRGFACSTCGASDLGAVQTNYLTVTTLTDSGAGSLRDAITWRALPARQTFSSSPV